MYALLLCNSLYEEFTIKRQVLRICFHDLPNLEEILAGHNMPARHMVERFGETETPAYFKYFWVLSSPSHQDKGTHFSI